MPNSIQWWRVEEVTQKGSKEDWIIGKALCLKWSGGYMSITAPYYFLLHEYIKI